MVADSLFGIAAAFIAVTCTYCHRLKHAWANHVYVNAFPSYTNWEAKKSPWDHEGLALHLTSEAVFDKMAFIFREIAPIESV